MVPWYTKHMNILLHLAVWGFFFIIGTLLGFMMAWPLVVAGTGKKL